jgi:PrgI family protein
MSQRENRTDVPYSVRIPADVEAPDKLVYGLPARQLAILAVAAAACWLAWRAVGRLVPSQLMLAGFVPVLAAAVGVALGRRDGLGMDVWLLAAVRQRRAPCRLVPAPDGLPAPPDWAPQLPARAGPAPAVLRLPAQAIGGDGVVELGGGRAGCLVAAGTVNIGLRTGEEQAGLLAGYGRWLNGLTGPVQVVISAARADLTGHALRVAEAAEVLPVRALVEAAGDYARFLLEVAAGRDPLARTVTVVCTAAGPNAVAEAVRRGGQTAAALAALGVEARVLDGAAVLAALTAAVDPYQPGDASWPRSLPDTPVREEGSSR